MALYTTVCATLLAAVIGSGVGVAAPLSPVPPLRQPPAATLTLHRGQRR